MDASIARQYKNIMAWPLLLVRIGATLATATSGRAATGSLIIAGVTGLGMWMMIGDGKQTIKDTWSKPHTSDVPVPQTTTTPS